MRLWAIADLHLAFGVPDKKMDVFGEAWVNYAQKIENHWREVVREEDLVLIAGDISWAMKLEEARVDLEWIDSLPGTKVMIKGNHDYWWSSLSKVKSVLPPSCHVIQNDAFEFDGVSVGGTRLWDSDEYSFNEFIQFQERPISAPKSKEEKPDQAKIFNREVDRLELSLKKMNPKAEVKIVMVHYPPIGNDLEDSRVSKLLEAYGIDVCLFGHLHNLKPNVKLFGEKKGILYALTSCDYLGFKPLEVIPPRKRGAA